MLALLDFAEGRRDSTLIDIGMRRLDIADTIRKMLDHLDDFLDVPPEKLPTDPIENSAVGLELKDLPAASPPPVDEASRARRLTVWTCAQGTPGFSIVMGWSWCRSIGERQRGRPHRLAVAVGRPIAVSAGAIWASESLPIMQSIFRLTARRRPAGSGKACHRAGD